jgi:hypothetical protein
MAHEKISFFWRLFESKTAGETGGFHLVAGAGLEPATSGYERQSPTAGFRASGLHFCSTLRFSVSKNLLDYNRHIDNQFIRFIA